MAWRPYEAPREPGKGADAPRPLLLGEEVLESARAGPGGTGMPDGIRSNGLRLAVRGMGHDPIDRGSFAERRACNRRAAGEGVDSSSCPRAGAMGTVIFHAGAGFRFDAFFQASARDRRTGTRGGRIFQPAGPWQGRRQGRWRQITRAPGRGKREGIR